MTNHNTSSDVDFKTSLSDAHPLLKGGKRFYPHSWNPQQIEVLEDICDTFVPSLPLEALHATYLTKTKADKEPHCSEKDIDALYRTSASSLKIHEEVAGLLIKWMNPKIVTALGIVLWLLSSRIGTLLLCGRLSCTRSFPYVERFSMLSNHRKEQILLSWKRSYLSAFQSVFKILKCYILWAFYTNVDENGNSKVWSGIGFYNSQKVSSEIKCRDSENQEAVLRPRLFDTEAGGVSGLRQFLDRVGCAPLGDVSSFNDCCSKGTEPDEKKDIAIKCDVVVVGSGSGGSVVAGILAQKGYSVVVLEKGKHFTAKDLSLLEGPTMQSMYEGGGVMGTDNGTLNILAGSTLGGGSAVNWSASICTPSHVLREWAKDHHLELFASADYKNALKEVCKRLGVQDNVKNESFQNAVLKRGCTKLGYHVQPIPRNADEDHDCGFCGLGCKSGGKQATTRTWLLDAAAAGAIILTGCRAEKILLQPGKGRGRKPFRIEGVQASLDPSSRLFVQAKCVVSACGSLMTPVLLQKSGLKNPNIGKFLHLHPTQTVWGYFAENSEPKGLSYEGAIMTSLSDEAANLGSSGYGALLEVPGILPGCFAAMIPWCSGADSKRRMSRYSRTASIIVLARDKGSGRVSLDKQGYRSITYELSPEDEESLKQGADIALRVLIAAGAQEVGTHHPDGDRLVVEKAEKSEIEDFLRRVRSKTLRQVSMSLASAHQMGSCRMGISPSSSAVDPKGESWEVEGLFIGDASVFPTASGVNPMVTAQSIAFCTSKNIVTYLRESS